MPKRKVHWGCLFLAEIRQAKMVSFVGESMEVIGDRQGLRITRPSEHNKSLERTML